MTQTKKLKKRKYLKHDEKKIKNIDSQLSKKETELLEKFKHTETKKEREKLLLKSPEVIDTLYKEEIKRYNGNRLLKKLGQKIRYTEEQLLELDKCIDDPVYFIKSYMKVVHIDKGLIPFNLYEFQEEMVQEMMDNRFLAVLSCRQSGKSVCMIGFLLWYILFNDYKACALLANKGATARMILQRLQLAYYNLPLWLQQGVKTWNKGSIELENGSSVIAASTSSDSIRGGSYSLVVIDEIAFIPQNTWNDFYDSTYPTITSGKESKLFVVSTPKGFNHFYKIVDDARQGKSKFSLFEVNWWDVPGRDKEWEQETIANIGEDRFSQEYGNAFLGSGDTLMSAYWLQNCVTREPVSLGLDGSLHIFNHPEFEHEYILIADCAEGGGDAQAFSVIDVTEFPWLQVARFKNHDTTYMEYPSIIDYVGKKYNNAGALIERNDLGRAVIDSLNLDLEYDNILSTRMKTNQGTSRVRMGLQTTRKSKPFGCLKLKEMLEKHLLIIQDEETLKELMNFVKNGKGSWEADEGFHDDLVMTLVLFAYWSSTQNFKIVYDKDYRKEYMERLEKEAEEHLSPLPIFSNGNGVFRLEDIIYDVGVTKEDLMALKG